MTTYQLPPELYQAAKRLVNNEDMVLLARYKMSELQEEIMNLTVEEEIIKVHTEHANIRSFFEWIESLAGTELQ